jgi:hypothetical protein
VAPSKIESKYRNQTLKKRDITVLNSPAKDLASIPQFVAPLDAFCDKKQLSLLPQFQQPQQEQPLPAIPSTDVQTSSHSIPSTFCEMESWQIQEIEKEIFTNAFG